MNIRTLFGLQTDGIVDRLVADHLVCTDVNETDGFGSRDDRSHLFVDGQLFHLFIGLLCHCRCSRKGTQQECTKTFDCSHTHSRITFYVNLSSFLYR